MSLQKNNIYIFLNIQSSWFIFFGTRKVYQKFYIILLNEKKVEYLHALNNI